MKANQEASVVRPDPTVGRQANAGYAAHYVASHEADEESLKYRLDYSGHLMLDRILAGGYSLLDVGCGTGGYLRLMKNHGQILGIDFSSEMITAAVRLKARLGLERVMFQNVRYEDFCTEQKFDAISLIGTFGAYVPWAHAEGALKRATEMLRDGGIACFSFVPPQSLIDYIKIAFFPQKTILIRRARLVRILAAAGLSELLELHLPRNSIIFCSKASAENFSSNA